MLRRQNFPADPMAFLLGESEMAERVRNFDWSNHPFGKPSTWPQSLRLALSICLNSSFPTAIYWGSDLRLLYNDAWSKIPGPRHPAALGAAGKDVWSDIWEIIEPQFSEVISEGTGVFFQNQMLPMQRYGVLEETYWNYSFTAIRGEDGAIQGIYNAGYETTSEVLSNRNLAFLLELNTALRNPENAPNLRKTAVRMLGEHLNVERAGLRWLDPLTRKLDIVEAWCLPSVNTIDSGFDLNEIGQWAYNQLASGKPLRINDISSDDRLGKGREAYGALGVNALIAVPWIEDRALTAIMFVHSGKARSWNDFDVSSVENVMEKTIETIVHQQTIDREKALMREVDHRAKNLLAIAQSIMHLTQADNIGEFRQKVASRISALANTHNLLALTHWQSLDLRNIIENELAPYMDRAHMIEIFGPKLLLNSSQSQMLTLFFHELFTNSVKYGALADAGGRIAVNWELDSHEVIAICWREYTNLSQRQSAQAVKKGFGTLLFERVIGQQLNGELTRHLLDDGLECKLKLPL